MNHQTREAISKKMAASSNAGSHGWDEIPLSPKEIAAQRTGTMRDIYAKTHKKVYIVCNGAGLVVEINSTKLAAPARNAEEAYSMIQQPAPDAAA